MDEDIQKFKEIIKVHQTENPFREEKTNEFNINQNNINHPDTTVQNNQKEFIKMDWMIDMNTSAIPKEEEVNNSLNQSDEALISKFFQTKNGIIEEQFQTSELVKDSIPNQSIQNIKNENIQIQSPPISNINKLIKTENQTNKNISNQNESLSINQNQSNLTSSLYTQNNSYHQTPKIDKNFFENLKKKEFSRMGITNQFSISDFHIGKKLGTGKFGRVYLVKEKKNKFYMCIKAFK